VLQEHLLEVSWREREMVPMGGREREMVPMALVYKHTDPCMNVINPSLWQWKC